MIQTPSLLGKTVKRLTTSDNVVKSWSGNMGREILGNIRVDS